MIRIKRIVEMAKQMTENNDSKLDIIKQRVEPTSSHVKVQNWLKDCLKLQHELSNDNGILMILSLFMKIMMILILIILQIFKM